MKWCPQTLVFGGRDAGLLTTLAIGSRIGADLLETLTSMFNPLPAIALLPLALIWFGLGQGSIIFVLVHSVLWDRFSYKIARANKESRAATELRCFHRK